MGRRLGKHPKRTPFYGVLMMLTAMISGLWVQNIPSLPLRVVIYVALFVLAAAGFLMTFRDYS
ncbi:hypothetical protein [Nocardia mexicana]|uniref:Uncharacterized protein n=1 Tax=Nocardia mexicana TaxID=279262 RepID=A0A370HCU2_9NOCA|nr:hypothetical protein [Nocardia mexicana]RDI54311.1 hypothetical protein DFR68_102435 [Nocardia mexicana]